MSFTLLSSNPFVNQIRRYRISGHRRRDISAYDEGSEYGPDQEMYHYSPREQTIPAKRYDNVGMVRQIESTFEWDEADAIREPNIIQAMRKFQGHQGLQSIMYRTGKFYLMHPVSTE